jgi:DNA-binding transcriptional ArsR family regulator
MNARRQIIAALSEDSLGGIATLHDVTRAEQLADAYRAELLAEVDALLEAERMEHADRRLFSEGIEQGRQAVKRLAAETREKATATAATATPNAAARQTKLLARIRDEGGHWKTGRVVRTYGQLGYSGSVRTARFDLAILRDSGAITEHNEKGVRFYTLNSQKGSRS